MSSNLIRKTLVKPKSCFLLKNLKREIEYEISKDLHYIIRKNSSEVKDEQ